MITAKKVTISHQGRPLSFAVNELRRGDSYIFFLHGLGCAKESFDEAFTFAGFGDYSLVSFDFIGFGDSDKPEDFSYSIEDHASVAAELVKAIAPGRVTIVAHSMGGAVGVLMVEQLGSDTVDAFISIEGNLVAEDCGIVSRGLANQSFEEFSDTGSVAFLEGLTASSRKDQQEWAGWYRKASDRALHQSAQSLVQWSDSGKLLGIFTGFPCKAYIYGDEGNKGFLLPKLMDTDIRCVEGAGHFAMVDKPLELYQNISSLLTEYST